ncbi:MAG: HIT domain-containing protein [Neisseriaceae bacterium]|nr:MAG: HIT domain-containing protein [Neisseriaceae bacterium]
MSSIFTQIINGDIPSYKVYETDRFIAILDINPNTKGHTLCIPKEETNIIFDMASKDYLDLMQFTYQVAQAIGKTIPCKRVGMAVVGLEVPHVHVHLIPINEMHEMTFQTKKQVSPEEMQAIAKAIHDSILINI